MSKRVVQLGALAVLDVRRDLEYSIRSAAGLLRKEPGPVTFIPDARDRYVTWAGVRVQDARQHFRRRHAVPCEAELHRLCLEASGQCFIAMSCVWCRSAAGTAHQLPRDRVRQLPGGAEIAMCTVMEGALSHALFDRDCCTVR